MTQKIRDHLVKAKALISDPEHWTRGEMARDVRGEHVSVHSPNATCFCSYGALVRVDPRHCDTALYSLRQAARELSGDDYDTVVRFNDKNPHARVMEMWDRAIEIAEGPAK